MLQLLLLAIFLSAAYVGWMILMIVFYKIADCFTPVKAKTVVKATFTDAQLKAFNERYTPTKFNK